MHMLALLACMLVLGALRAAWRVAACLFAADAITGLVHWLEDSYGRPSWPLIGPAVIVPNREHHAYPRKFLEHSVWRSLDLQVWIGLAVLGALALGGLLTPEVALVVVLLIGANAVHRWAHASPRENGTFVTWLQRLRLVQGRAHHGRHHARRADSHYCVITPWLNPLCDRLGLWRGLERLVTGLSGVHPLVAGA